MTAKSIVKGLIVHICTSELVMLPAAFLIVVFLGRLGLSDFWSVLIIGIAVLVSLSAGIIRKRAAPLGRTKLS